MSSFFSFKMSYHLICQLRTLLQHRPNQLPVEVGRGLCIEDLGPRSALHHRQQQTGHPLLQLRHLSLEDLDAVPLAGGQVLGIDPSKQLPGENHIRFFLEASILIGSGKCKCGNLCVQIAFKILLKKHTVNVQYIMAIIVTVTKSIPKNNSLNVWPAISGLSSSVALSPSVAPEKASSRAQST